MRVIKAKLFLLAVVLLSVLVAPVSAQQRIKITEGQVAPTPIAIAEFTNLDGEVSVVGRQISEIISNDLLSSGLFEPIDSAAFIAPPKSPAIRPDFANWAPLGAKGLLVGSAEIDADGKLQVEFVLWDV
ncbi:MAG: Tol-Pal system protein TolB, partial [Alphaproteobacteria bacterium]